MKEETKEYIYFDYKLSVYITLILFLSSLIIPLVLELLGLKSQILVSIVGGIVAGYSISGLIYKKKQYQRNSFWLIGSLLAVLFGGIIFSFYSLNILF